jgi:invasion protein IalB
MVMIARAAACVLPTRDSRRVKFNQTPKKASLRHPMILQIHTAPLLASVAVFGLSFVPGHAQTPQRTTASYEDWTVSCAVTTAGHKSCGLVQTLRSQSTPAGQIGVGRSADGGTMRLSVEVRANVWLPSGLKFALSDGKAVVSATFKLCVAGRCIAEADLTNDQIDKIRAQTEAGSVEYANAAQANVSLPVSFHGFAEAMDALKKEQSSLGPDSGPTRDRFAAGDSRQLDSPVPPQAGEQQGRNGPPFQNYDNYDLTGPVNRMLKEVELQACSDACRSDNDCQAFSYNKWKRQCSLKHAAGSFRFEPRSVSGLAESSPAPPSSKRSVVMECSREAIAGHSRSSSTPELSSFEQCRDSCQGDQQCVAFTFGENHNCTTFQTADGASADAGVVSGVKRQLGTSDQSWGAACSAFDPIGQLGLGLAAEAGAGSAGVIVANVDPEGIAAVRGLRNGDVILEVSHEAVKVPSDVDNALDEARRTGKRSVLLRVKSGDGTHFGDEHFVALTTGSGGNEAVGRGWIGTRIEHVNDDIAKSLKLTSASGALVAEVADNGPGKTAGLQPGDVIVQVDGEDIKDARDVPPIIADIPVGLEVQFVLIRDRKELTVPVKVGRLPQADEHGANSTSAPHSNNADEGVTGFILPNSSD